MNKKLIALITVVVMCMSTTACSKNDDAKAPAVVEAVQSSTEVNDGDLVIGTITATIALGDTITASGTGATVDGSTVTITSGGTYSISGTLKDGQIIVDSQDEENVKLLLNGANITCLSSAPIYVKNAKNAVIILGEGTENSVTDGASYVLQDTESGEPNAAIFSKDDLKIGGSGSLTVNATYNDGIASKDDLIISEGNIAITSICDGLRGKDTVTLKGGSTTINAGSDGIKVTNAEDSEKGYFIMEGGAINITAGEDGIQAETNATINDGNITISSGGGSANSSSNSGEPMNTWGDWGAKDTKTADSDTASAKGIKATSNITIGGGTINIDSSDDAMHSNNSLIVNGGTMNISSGDDGMHSDTTLEINSGTITIAKSYEAIESTAITINDGNINVTSSDDGVNASGGNDGSSTNGRVGENPLSSSGDGLITINGGYLTVDATGDGLDANGSIKITNGTVIVNGPINDGNGPLDYDGTFDVTGGFIVAAGSSGMAQSPSTSSTQNSISLTLTSQEAGTLVHIQSEDGEDVLTFAPSKTFASVVVCSPEIKKGSTYTAYTGGSSTGTATNGLYYHGTYTAGTKIGSSKVSDVVTSIVQDGASVGRNNGGMPGGNPGGAPSGTPGGMPSGRP